MSATTVYQTVASVGIGSGKTMPCAHVCFRKGSAPALPWCVYFLDEQSGFDADDLLYARHDNWVVEHYFASYDANIESGLESALKEHFGSFRKEETWVDEENCYMTSYYFEEIESEES